MRRARVLIVGWALLVAATGCSSTPAPGVPSAGSVPPSEAESADDTSPTRSTPNADGDVPVDVGRLRFAEPLPSDAVAFLNAPADYPPPERERRGTASAADPSHVADSVSFVAMDGPRLLMSGAVADVDPDDVPAPFDGDPVDIGVDGARYSDDDEGAIVFPVGDAVRVVAPRDFYSFGGGGPYVDDAVLIETARTIGATPLAEVDDLGGVSVYAGTIAGAAVDPLGVGDARVIRHGAGASAPIAALHRLARTPSALELAGYANALTGGLRDAPAIGDVAFVGASPIYVELVSPVDLLVVRHETEEGLAAAVAVVDVTAAAELDAAFDGTITAPAPPGGVRLAESPGVSEP